MELTISFKTLSSMYVSYYFKFFAKTSLLSKQLKYLTEFFIDWKVKNTEKPFFFSQS